MNKVILPLNFYLFLQRKYIFLFSKLCLRYTHNEISTNGSRIGFQQDKSKKKAAEMLCLTKSSNFILVE